MVFDFTSLRQSLESGVPISQAVVNEHQRIERLVGQLVQLAADADVAELRVAFKALIIAMESHEVLESRVIFPIFEELVGVAQDGPTTILHRDHHAMDLRLKTVDSLLQNGAGASSELVEVLSSLSALVRSHFRRERVVYETYGPSLAPAQLLQAMSLIDGS